MSFFIGTCAWLPGLLSIVSAADVIVSCLQALNSSWLPQPWQQGLVIIAVIVVTGVIATQRTRTASVYHFSRLCCDLSGSSPG